ncbi:MAG: proprotein convertase P-domain-containing protein [Planctomycetota bacterium]
MPNKRRLWVTGLVLFTTIEVLAQQPRGHSIMVEGQALAKGCSDTIATEPNVIYNVLPGGGLIQATTVLRDVLLSIDSNLRVDALSYGRDFGYHKNDHSYFLFSIDLPEETSSSRESPAYCEPRSEVSGDLYWVADFQDPTTSRGTHGKASDENDASPGETNFPRNNFFQVEPCLGLAGTHGSPSRGGDASHRITAFDYWPWTYDCDIYFSVNATFAVGFQTFHPADVLLLPKGASSSADIQIFISQQDLELGNGDNINALALNLRGLEFVDNAFQSSFPAVLWFSLAMGSARLDSLGRSPADIFLYELPDGQGTSLPPQLHRTAESMGIEFSTLGVNGCVGSLGHIDPEVIQSLTQKSGIQPGTSIEGFLGMTVSSTGEVQLGPSFGSFDGDLSFAFDGQPVFAGQGTVRDLQLAVTVGDGDVGLFEAVGSKAIRDIIDLELVQGPVGHSLVVTNINAVPNPMTGVIAWTWANPGGTAIVRVDGSPPTLAGSTGFTSQPLDPGQHLLQVNLQTASGMGPPVFSSVLVEHPNSTQIIQPPHALAVSVQSGLVSVTWRNPTATSANPMAYDHVRVTVGGLSECLATGGEATGAWSTDQLAPGLYKLELQGFVGPCGSTGARSVRSAARVRVPYPRPGEDLQAPGNNPGGILGVTQVGGVVIVVTGTTARRYELGSLAPATPPSLTVPAGVGAVRGITNDGSSLYWLGVSGNNVQVVRSTLTGVPQGTVSLSPPVGYQVRDIAFEAVAGGNGRLWVALDSLPSPGSTQLASFDAVTGSPGPSILLSDQQGPGTLTGVAVRPGPTSSLFEVVHGHASGQRQVSVIDSSGQIRRSVSRDATPPLVRAVEYLPAGSTGIPSLLLVTAMGAIREVAAIDPVPGAGDVDAHDQLGDTLKVSFPAPQTIAPGSPIAPVVTTSTLTLPASGNILDLDVLLTLDHRFPEALTVELTSPSGTTIQLIAAQGSNATHIDRRIDDLCPAGVSDGFGDHRPQDPVKILADFDGQAVAGTWTVDITNYAGCSGEIAKLDLWIEHSPVSGPAVAGPFGSANDECVGATPVVLGTNAISNVMATLGADPLPALPCAVLGDMDGDVWYTFTATSTAAHEFNTCNLAGGWDTDMALYEGACGALVQIACNGDGTGLAGCQPFYSRFTANLTAGTTYIVRIGSWDPGDFNAGVLNIIAVAAVESCTNGIDDDLDGLVDCFDVADCPTGVAPCIEAGNCADGIDNDTDGLIDCNDGNCAGDVACLVGGNDFCGGALPVLCGEVVMGDTSLATAEPWPTCGTTSGTGGGVWYQFAGNGDQVTLTTCSVGTAYDTKIRVWSGSCAAPVCVAGDDDDPTCAVNGLHSTVSFLTTVGETYFILVHGFGANQGLFEMTVTCLTPGVEDCMNGLDDDLDGLVDCADPDCVAFPACAPPANDECVGATAAVLGANAISNVNATDSAEPPPVGPCNVFGDNSDDVWYSFTAMTTAAHLIDTCDPAGWDTDLTIYEGSCGALVEVACNGDGVGLVGCQAFYSALSAPLTSGVTYLIRVGSFTTGVESSGTLNIGVNCGDLGAVTCAYDCATDMLTIIWTDNALATSGYDILENGIQIGFAGSGASSFSVVSPPAGLNTYTVEWACSLGGMGTTGTCTVTVQPPIAIPGGTTDVILHLEGLQNAGALGQIDSGVALEAALVANGRTVARIAPNNFDLLIAGGCLDPSGADTIWVMAGTFPNDYRISMGEGDALAALAVAGAGIYFEAGDHWGFQHVVSLLDDRDGIDAVGSADGDDTYGQMDGANAPLAGLDLSAIVDVAYTQDQAGNDFTDRLAITGTDASVTSVEAIWTNSDDTMTGEVAYVTGAIAVHADGGVMISTSWEFGGYGGSQDALALAYLFALGRGLGCGDLGAVTCSYSCATDMLTINWTNSALATAGYTILENGVVVGSRPAGSSSFALANPVTGTNTYTVEWACSLGGSGPDGSCTIDVQPPIVIPSTTRHVILALEGLQSGGDFGLTNSGEALRAALIANSCEVLSIAPSNFDQLIDAGCLDLSGVETLWVLTGTFPADYRLSSEEGDALAALAASGVGLYLEGGDHWGFQHVVSLLDDRDGVEADLGGNIVDGDDTFTQMDGADATGLELGTHSNIFYSQDQLGNDFTDRLSVTGTTSGAEDTGVASAEVIWRNSDDTQTGEAPYVTGVFAYHNDGGRMIAVSWEFGGYTCSMMTLAGAYLAALSSPALPSTANFRRGNCNNDNALNIADAVYALGALFPTPGGNPNPIPCLDACDANDDGVINIADAVSLLFALFGGSPLPAPGSACGADPTPSIGCATSTCP